MWEYADTFMATRQWIAVLVGAAIGAFVAALTIQTQRSINRRRATIDMLSAKLWDHDYISASDCFYHAMKEQRKLMVYYDKFTECRSMKNNGEWDNLSESRKKEYDAPMEVMSKIRSVLNDRELVAIGIREGTYDEVIYRRWWYFTFIQEWRQAAPLIARIRADPQTGPASAAYAEMEALAKRWQAEGVWTQTERHIRLPWLGNVTISRSR
jgi:hypothetical protein